MYGYCVYRWGFDQLVSSRATTAYLFLVSLRHLLYDFFVSMYSLTSRSGRNIAALETHLCKDETMIFGLRRDAKGRVARPAICSQNSSCNFEEV